MAESAARFALHREELSDSLIAGDRKIAALMKGSAQVYPADQLLIEANTDHPYVYRLVEGWASRTRTLSDGREQCILIFLPGDLFAVKSMFVDRHPDSVRVLSRSVAERIDQRELHRIFREDADVANRCIWQVVEEERRLHSWVTGLGQGSAEERLALLLMDFLGRLTASGFLPIGAEKYSMPLTQVQLADHLGLTAIHVNRVLRGLRENGIVTVRDGEVQIHDVTRLRAVAYPLLDPYERNSPYYAGRVVTPMSVNAR